MVARRSMRASIVVRTRLSLSKCSTENIFIGSEMLSVNRVTNIRTAVDGPNMQCSLSCKADKISMSRSLYDVDVERVVNLFCKYNIWISFSNISMFAEISSNF